MSKLNSVCVFQGQLVLFSEDGIQVWDVDPDPLKNYLVRSLTNTGCLAPRSVLNFGNFDTVFLAKSGIRSLQARQATDLMNVNDIGTPVDDFVSQLVAAAGVEQIRRLATAVVEPEDARLWVSLGDVIMVHSYYKGNDNSGDISAWSTYTPGFNVQGMTVMGGATFIRSGDVIYQYGGPSKLVYDSCKAEVWTPFHHADKPATQKAFTGFDVGGTGEWTIKAAFDPRKPDLSEYVGKVTDATWAEPSEGLNYYSSHLSLVLECSDAQPARMNNLAMHYNEGVAT
jgi:hypothetical protein